MATDTKIEWCSHTFNPWSGCTKIAPGCENCYAADSYSVKVRGVTWGPKGKRVRAADSGWRKPLAWNRAAEKAGERRRVFCASLADVFEDWQGPILDHNDKELRYMSGDPECMVDRGPVTMDMLRADLFRRIDQTPHLDWLLLTKRPENIRRMWGPSPALAQYMAGMGEEARANMMAGRPSLYQRKNVWLGCSVSDQPTADALIPRLLECRDLSPVLFVSAEPLLGPVDASEYLQGRRHAGGGCVVCGQSVRCRCEPGFPSIDWLIIGGESGPRCRPCDTQWGRSLLHQCQAANVACFIKQLGGGAYSSNDQDARKPGQGLFRDPKGGDMEEWPEDLRVREFPR